MRSFHSREQQEAEAEKEEKTQFHIFQAPYHQMNGMKPKFYKVEAEKSSEK